MIFFTVQKVSLFQRKEFEMLDVVKYFHAGLCAVMIFPVCAVPWNPATWFKEPAVSPPGFFSETMQVMQKNPYCQKIYGFGQQSAQEAYQTSVSLINYVQRYPGQAIAVLSSAAGAYALYHLITLHADVQKKDSWAFWKSEIVFDTRNSSLAMDELIYEIQVRYLDVQHIADLMGPIQRFIFAIDREIHQLNRYAWYAQQLQAVGLERCIDVPLLHEVDRRVERLHHLKMMSIRWLSEAKVGSRSV